MESNFTATYIGQERGARQLLLRKKIKTEKELALMSCRDVEETIDQEFVSIQVGEDWILIPNGKYNEFQRIVEWINR